MHNATSVAPENGVNTVDQLQQKIQDFRQLQPADFFAKYDDHMAFILAVPKQKAIKRVMSGVFEKLEGHVMIKPTNKRDSSSYAIDTNTGMVFGVTEIKPGGLRNAFTLSANENSPKGTRYVKKEIDKAPAPVIGIIGEDTYAGLKAEYTKALETVTIFKALNTSHSGLYLGARNADAIEKIGHVPVKIAATDRYIPLLEKHIEEMSKQPNAPQPFIAPEFISCDGGTEDYLDTYGDIDVICDIFDSGSSVLNAGVTHAKLLKLSKAVVVYNSDICTEFNTHHRDITTFVKLLDQKTNEHFKETHPHLLNKEQAYQLAPHKIITAEELFHIMESDIDSVAERLAKNDNQPFYDVVQLAATPE